MNINSALNVAGNTIVEYGNDMQLIANSLANINTPYYQSSDRYTQLGNLAAEMSRDLSYGEFIYENADIYPEYEELSSESQEYADEVYGMIQNDVNVAAEYVNLIQTENNLAANTKVVSSIESMNGYLMDLTV